jgi:hypothetical protein
MTGSFRQNLTQAAARAWQILARIVSGKTRDRHRLPLSKLPEQFVPDREISPGRPAALDRWENEGGAARRSAYASPLPPSPIPGAMKGISP